MVILTVWRGGVSVVFACIKKNDLNLLLLLLLLPMAAIATATSENGLEFDAGGFGAIVKYFKVASDQRMERLWIKREMHPDKKMSVCLGF